MKKKNIGLIMWVIRDHTISYCPKCRIQRTFHSKDINNIRYWFCDVCNLKMIYNYKDDSLHLA